MKKGLFITCNLVLLLAGCKTANTGTLSSDLQMEVVREACIVALQNSSVEVRITNRSSSHLVANSKHFYLAGILDENKQYVMPFITTCDLLTTSPHWDELPKDSTVSIRVDLIDLRKYRLQSGRYYTLIVGYFRPKPKGRNAVKNEMPDAKVWSNKLQVCIE